MGGARCPASRCPGRPAGPWPPGRTDRDGTSGAPPRRPLAVTARNPTPPDGRALGSWGRGWGEGGEDRGLEGAGGVGRGHATGVDLFGSGVEQAVDDRHEPAAGKVGAEAAFGLAPGDEL